MTIETAPKAPRLRQTRTAMFAELFSAPAPDPSRLGGKGASLARLVNLGYRVPPGFTITVDAFLATITSLGLLSLFEELSSSMKNDVDFPSASEITQALSTGRLPDQVAAEIDFLTEQLQLWRNSPDGLIVRSSATVEDSTSLSFAGIFESIAISDPEQLEATIMMVWSSVFARRALTYANESGMRSVPKMAVVVQRFLQADRSGVMFTRFPDYEGVSKVLIEHVEGDCEKLVKGEVSPERLWLEPSSAVPGELSGLLAPKHARELVTLAESLEKDFGRPQDVEWCIYDNDVHVVQSRPITALFGTESSEVRDAEPILRGVPASPGVGRGPSYLVFNIEQALGLSSGQVLVTPMTNPDMVVAMRNSVGIVTDVGGMICHAAIVSRELGLPCVVGTGDATTTLRNDQIVTVDGSVGAVYDGDLDIGEGSDARPMEWEDLWSRWESGTSEARAVIPLMSSSQALSASPESVHEAALLPDIDLRATPHGLWADLEALSPADLTKLFDQYLHSVGRALTGSACKKLHLVDVGAMPQGVLANAIKRSGDNRLKLLPARVTGHQLRVGDKRLMPLGAAALPVTAGAASMNGMDEIKRAALDTLRFFGHQPAVRTAEMPDASTRRQWWNTLPEYGRFHQEHDTQFVEGEFDWLEVRPELVISPLLKSLVQPGFEMVPRVMGFAGLPPMHIKWIKCRYHFRSDTFDQVWKAIVHATWNEKYMAYLMRTVRASYEHLGEFQVLFPSTASELTALTPGHIAALVTSWWPRWIEFFALCWFIQAQGDDILFPFIRETVEGNLSALDGPKGLSWLGIADLVAPTTPVMSGEYMASLATIRDALLANGLTDAAEALEQLRSGKYPSISRQIQAHIRDWGWMRDRDLLFEPWDTTERVVATAIATGMHSVSDYRDNLQRNIAALSFHYDVSQSQSRAQALNFAVRYLHDLNVERENHHVLWLKFSYPLRRVVLEIERRLIEIGSLDEGDVFFLQAPELLSATQRLPEPLPDELVDLIKNRRAAYLKESQLATPTAAEPHREDDYY